MPRHKIPDNFDSDAKNKSFSTATQEQKQCRYNQTGIKSLSTTDTTTKNISSYTGVKKVRSPTLKSSQFGPPTRNANPISCSHSKQLIFAPPSKTKLISTHARTKPTLSLHWNKVKFDPPDWNQFNLAHPHLNQVNFHAHPKKHFGQLIRNKSTFPPT